VTATDTLGFVDAVRSLPEQLAVARTVAASADLSRLTSHEVRSVVVCGMGGSGISGDVLAAIAAPVAEVPIVVVKGYELPKFVGPTTLVFAASYSGGTEETLEAALRAIDAKAALVAVTKGGSLGDLARDHGWPVVPCPDGLMPRAAVAALSVPLFLTLEQIGLLPGISAELDRAARALAAERDRCAPEITAPVNPARELARRIGRSIPLVYGGGAIGAVAASRWKADVNENAKAPAFWHWYPELDHNEICGWGQHGDVTRQVFTLVELRHDHEHPQVARRFAITRGIIEEALQQVLEARAQGDGPLAQLLDLMYLGDWTSVYLALDAGVDPGPIDAIFRLKDELAD
jgi:glucose/mannose-6-phosphate isomerase